MTYDIYFSSEKKNGKLKNGDNFNFKKITDEHLVIFCIADGVGSTQKDWLASETACKCFADSFSICSGSIEERIKKSVLNSHKRVRTLASGFSMMTTFAAVVIDETLDLIKYVNIGDSRIFLLNNEGIKLLSVDDSVSIPIKYNNELILSGGSPLLEHPITKAIGQTEQLEFDIFTYPFKPSESIVLATDGIHNHGMLPYSITKLFNLRNISLKLTNEVKECSIENNDDATILIFRRSDYEKNQRILYENVLLNSKDYLAEKLYSHILIDIATELLQESIEKSDIERMKTCLQYLYDKKLLVDKERLIKWLDKIVLMKDHNRDIQIILRKLIQISL